MESPYKQSDLTEKEKLKAHDFYWFLDTLKIFQTKATPNLFNWLWGEQQGEHLWEKFVIDCNRDIMNFLSKCSSDVKITLVCNLCKDNPTNMASRLYLHC